MIAEAACFRPHRKHGRWGEDTQSETGKNRDLAAGPANAAGAANPQGPPWKPEAFRAAVQCPQSATNFSRRLQNTRLFFRFFCGGTRTGRTKAGRGQQQSTACDRAGQNRRMNHGNGKVRVVASATHIPERRKPTQLGFLSVPPTIWVLPFGRPKTEAFEGGRARSQSSTKRATAEDSGCGWVLSECGRDKDWRAPRFE